MILTDRFLKTAMEHENIIIKPFFDSIGTNSIDLHLAPTLLRYKDTVLDCAKLNECVEEIIPLEGMILQPGELYLGATIEWTKSDMYVPLLEGKSSIGRLGISVHITAGVGDIGFEGHWTLEITVEKPIRVYAGMPVAQLLYFVAGECDRAYTQKSDSKYGAIQHTPKPVASQMFKNFPLKPAVLRHLSQV